MPNLYAFFDYLERNKLPSPRGSAARVLDGGWKKDKLWVDVVCHVRFQLTTCVYDMIPVTSALKLSLLLLFLLFSFSRKFESNLIKINIYLKRRNSTRKVQNKMGGGGESSIYLKSSLIHLNQSRWWIDMEKKEERTDLMRTVFRIKFNLRTGAEDLSQSKPESTR